MKAVLLGNIFTKHIYLFKRILIVCLILFVGIGASAQTNYVDAVCSGVLKSFQRPAEAPLVTYTWTSTYNSSCGTISSGLSTGQDLVYSNFGQ